jgi:V/A-type H+-transporting ATPase subunit I
MMFGDVGHGGMLFAAGYLIFRRFYRYFDYGIILMECGVSSMLFGFLYGSVFGFETVIPALWFRPMESIPYFVKATLTLGVLMVSLGLAINVINAVRLKELEKVFSGSGLAGALLYWMAAGLGLKRLVTGTVTPEELNFVGWIAAVLMTVMLFHRPLYRVFVKRDRFSHILKQSGFFTEMVESVIELVDDLMRFVANTVSFLRVAAFALSHAALFIAVFSIANIISHEKGGGFSYWLVVALGNIVVILMEGVVVSIQTVRLEYYEFFGKFFRGGGERFKSFDSEIGSSDERKL